MLPSDFTTLGKTAGEGAGKQRGRGGLRGGGCVGLPRALAPANPPHHWFAQPQGVEPEEQST